MSNPNDLNSAIENLNRELARETGELHAKEAELKRTDEEIAVLTHDIPAEEQKAKIEEEDAKKLKQDAVNKKIKLAEDQKRHNRLKQEVANIGRDQQAKHTKLTQAQRDYTASLKQSGLKLK